ncbi:hypothetical protein H4R19_001284 [Coemansia spiralis]|nr:hypothetical protein H4R19_001284 [Coemansia spiralis]
MMARSATLHDIMPQHLYLSLQAAANMNNFPSVNNLGAPFQSLGNYTQPRQPQHPNQPPDADRRQPQASHQGYRQGQFRGDQDQHHHPYDQHQHQRHRLGHSSPFVERQSSETHLSNLAFDISAFNNPSATSTPPHADAGQGAPARGTMSAGGYPFSLDTAGLHNPPALPGLGGMDDLGQMSAGAGGTDDDAAAYGQGSRADTMVHAGQLTLSGLSSMAGGSSSVFIGSTLGPHLGVQHGSLSAPQHQHHQSHQHSLGLQMTPQPPDSLHQAMSMTPQVRPYNMMFGVPGLADHHMVYDERAAMPHMHTASGSWLRIRQPIDYVAPLKKPMNSFLLYSAERRVQLRQTHPDLNTTQQSTILAREWANLADDEKEKYRAEAKQLRDDYNARRAELSLKLQQQLSQQHLGLTLSHPPPPPPPPPPPMLSHGAMHLPPQEMLGQGVGPDGHQHVSMHSASPFGLPQHSFGGPGMQLSHAQFQPPSAQLAPHGAAHFHQTPGPPFPQTPHEDMFGYSQAPAGVAVEQLQFENALSALGPAGNSSAYAPPLMVDRNSSMGLDVGASGFVSGVYGGKQGPPPPPPWESQYAGFGANAQSSFGEQDIVASGMLSAVNSLFDRPLDGVFPAGQLEGGMGGFADQEPMHSGSELRSDAGQSVTMGRLGAIVHSDSAADADARSGPGSATAAAATGGTAAQQERKTTSSKSRARGSSPAKRARKKSKKDPDAPKHPMSAFLYYLTSERPRLADQMVDMSIGQQTKIVAKKWKTLDEHDRAPWEEMAQHDKDRYARERREYNSESRLPDNSTERA